MHVMKKGKGGGEGEYAWVIVAIICNNYFTAPAPAWPVLLLRCHGHTVDQAGTATADLRDLRQYLCIHTLCDQSMFMLLCVYYDYFRITLCTHFYLIDILFMPKASINIHRPLYLFSILKLIIILQHSLVIINLTNHECQRMVRFI